MTRFLPNQPVQTARSLDPGAVRPPLDQIPAELADVIRERDRITGQRDAALALVHSLDQQGVEDAALKADHETAAAAARKGKPIPAPTAMPKLKQDREVAARAAAAQEAARLAVTDEAEDLRAKLWEANDEQATAQLAKARAEIEVAANELADRVEAAVAASAAHAWLRTGVYFTRATTWPTEAIDLARYSLDRNNTTPVSVRDILTRAATTVLED